jgi:two-component system nitrate/nitrite response regulator NarL
VDVLIVGANVLESQLIGARLSMDSNATPHYARSIEAAIEALQRSNNFSLILLECSSIGLDGLTAVCAVAEHSGGAPLVLLSHMGPVSSEDISSLIAAGVKGVIPQAMDIDAFLSTLQLVIAGESYVPPDSIQERNALLAKYNFTSSELAVLRGICEAKSNKVIASDLGLHEATVKLHAKTAFRKLGVTSRTEAAIKAIGLRFFYPLFLQWAFAGE